MKYTTLAKVLVCLFLMQLSVQSSAEAQSPGQRSDMHRWFEQFKDSASDGQLYEFLYRMPKGGDLHNHLSGSAYPIWWYETALAQAERGYQYYTKTHIENCLAPDQQAPAFQPYYLLYRNITAVQYEQLSECEQAEYRALDQLTSEEKAAWFNALRLDKPSEGRHEFFERHWQRLNVLPRNPYLMAELLYRNMVAFAAEGLQYLEMQVFVDGLQRPDGSVFTPAQVADIYRQRLAQEDAQATGVTVRFQLAILRFARSAEQDLKRSYQFIHDNADYWVGLNMVGREDNDKGYPLRFLPALREMRRQYDGVKLSIHAGEVDEPNEHVRDTLLLGADRIGHGLNLITDPDTLLLMRHGPYLVEINLVSNLLLEYVSDYQQHPFPEYLRTGIPVALSTDDRGMWDSQITDEFFVAVKEFDLSWAELQQLHVNSLEHGFMARELKQQLLAKHRKTTELFSQAYLNQKAETLTATTRPSAFICRQYGLCASSASGNRL